MSLLSQFSAGGVSKNIITVEILAVGGGGGGGTGAPTPSPSPLGGAASGAGGGAGGVLYQRIEVTPGVTYTISIGSGGSGGIGSTVTSVRTGSVGNNTYFGNVFAGGGGAGGGAISNSVEYFGSGGGVGEWPSGNATSAPPTYSRAQSNITFANSLNKRFYEYLAYPSIPISIGTKSISRSSGGGGASGFIKTLNTGEVINGVGMDGIPAEAIGISTIAVGGGGSGDYPGTTPGPSASILGGGGSFPGGNGTSNTGGGGGGSSGPAGTGGSGGSGVLFIRYPTQYAAATVTGNTPAPAQPGYYVYRWNSGPGSIVFN